MIRATSLNALKFFAVAALLGSVLYSGHAFKSRSVPAETHIASAPHVRQESLSPDVTPINTLKQPFQIFSPPSQKVPVEGIPPFVPAPQQGNAPATSLSTSPFHTISDNEIFHIQHPPFYIDYLTRIEDLMVRDGLLGTENRQTFDSESKVLAFWRDHAFDYMVAEHFASEADRGRFNRGLELVRELHVNEARLLREGVTKIGDQPLAVRMAQYILAELTAPVKKAEAAAAVGGGCYRSGPPTSAVGINLPAICCDCNGPFDVPLGCLNLICYGRPALYDPTTFICGCG